MKKVKVLGKMIPVFVLVLLGIGMVSATLLTYFGVITGTVTVEQSVLVDGKDVGTGSLTLTDDGTGHTVKNNAGVIAPIKFETSYLKDLGWTDGVGITTSYVGVLELTKKDTADWTPIGNPILIVYTIVGDTFEFSGVPEGHTLIYYKDFVVGLEGRLANPQPAIIVTSDIGNLPQNDDANIDELADYCVAPDNYLHCKGAKLWVVLTSDITNNNLNWANMANYYYETDLIEYNKEGEITIYPNEVLDFQIVNDFDVALWPGTYTITTNIKPVTV